MNGQRLTPLLLSILITACALPFGGAPLQQLYTTAARKSYEIAQEERTAATLAFDNKIVLSLTDKFTQDSAINPFDVSPYCYEGRVYLVGEYDTDEEWTRAIEITARESGVKSITTYILMKEGAPACGMLDNFMIYANVRAKLILDEELRSTNIDIKAVQCQVILLGIVASPAEIDRAVGHAQGVDGVLRVQSFLEARRRAVADGEPEMPE